MVLVAVAGGIRAAAVGDEYQVILDEVEGLLLAVLDVDDLLCDLLSADVLNYDVLNVHTVFNAHAVGFQILYQRHDKALVLVELRESQCAEIREPVYVVDETAEVALHFKRTGPALECEHCLPVEPEVRAPEGIRQHLGDFLPLQILLGSDEELGQRHCGFLVQVELAVRVGVLAAVNGGAAEGVVRVVLVQPVVLVKY